MLNAFYTAADCERYTHAKETSDKDDRRTPFQVDRDRVVFSFAFRRLQSKTQVFQSGEYDFYRTRLTHSLEVARIARSIGDHLAQHEADALNGAHIDCDLLEAIGLSHDLGHPPFGHIGERKLNELMRDYGGFEGNAQTLRILTDLIWEHPQRPEGMRPTRAFLDGVLKYKALWTEAYLQNDWQHPYHHFLYDNQKPIRDFVFYGQAEPTELRQVRRMNGLRSIECQIMDWADDTAYCLHDIVDGVKAGFVSLGSVEQWASEQSDADQIQDVVEKLLKRIRAQRLEISFAAKVGDFIRASSLEARDGFLSQVTQRHAWHLKLDADIQREAAIYKRIALDLIFKSARLQQIEFKGGRIIEELFHCIADNYLSRQSRHLNILPAEVERWLRDVHDEASRARCICDYLAGCTDTHAIRLYKRLFDPDYGSITDLN